ncbi:serine/threonine-protein phosphatase 2A regulatory subunit B'' subunit alpha [Musca vetustissima]|uniref:serine/threonine-protein phosphatase 2A regulatory subunit B'' subunit alpha n=1 Tax=Musca vetustissima TaxID=27455 RepID=UPI002AB7AC0B|nr:serine/threonine-protein phosphatase 2A regulatory subunit B'' subunit alpha [Musca vetustissima]
MQSSTASVATSSSASTASTKSPSSSKSSGLHSSSSSTKLMQPSKQSVGKTKSTPNVTTVPIMLNNGATITGGRDLQTSLEIEEISKKISEHADALYRTWKSHGIAPTEILDIYTAEAAAATGSITEDVKSTEGLHKLVNSFVIKDKEQRGVQGGKVAGGSSVGGGGVKTTTTKTEGKLNSSQTKRQRSPSPSSKQAINNSSSSSSTTSSTLSSSGTLKSAVLNSLDKSADILNTKKSTAVTTSTPNSTSPTTTKINSNSKLGSSGFLLNNKVSSRLADLEAELELTKPTTHTTATTTKFKSSPKTGESVSKLSTPSKTLDLNFDISLDLNLDIPALTLQQSENLQKIKELLQQETPTHPVGGAMKSNSKIPSVIIEKSASTSPSNKQVKVKKSSTLEKSDKKLRDSSPTLGATLHKEEPLNEVTTKLQKKTNTNAGETTTPSSTSPTGKKVSTKTKTSHRPHPVEEVVNQLLNTLQEPLEKSLGEQLTSVADKSIRKSDKNKDTGPSSNGNVVAVATKKRTTTTATSPQSSALSNGIIDTHLSNIRTAINEPSLISTDLIEKTTAEVEKIQTELKASESQDAKANSSANVVKLQKTGSKSTKTSTKSSKTKDSSSATTKTTKSAVTEETKENSDTVDSTKSTTPPASNNMNGSSILTPTKLKSTRPLTNGQEKAVRSPFLTRGSVAERVLMFEKCPDVRNSFLNIKRPDPADAPPKSLLKAKLHATPPPPPSDHTSLQREIRSTKSVYIPRFYFPHGKPQPTIALERTLRGILAAFDTFPNNQVTRDELPRILKICGLPFYWRMPVMVFCQQGNSGLVERQRFVEFWKQMNVYCHDEASRFVYILSRGQRMRSYILPEDLAPLVQDVVDTHPGLAFLKEATEFHSRYVHTVIARIFYNVNRSWSGKITISELKKSDLLEVIGLLEEEDDINQIMAYFSYEHFYVIYCKFWELDKDHDLLINQDDLARHSDHALSTRIVERIFSGCVTRSDNKKNPDDEPKMSYSDFVWFLLSEEDKRTPTAIEYWFRCMDIDGDGVISMYELEYFYEEQQQRMESIGIESLPFEDCLCQMLDMIKPKRRDAITLGDLKNCKMTHVFFDTFFNLEKYLDHEQRDPFASQRDEYTSDWDRFAAQEYELLITEEND